MAKTKKSKEVHKGELVRVYNFGPGNKAACKPYEYKLMRENLKTNLFKAINYLNMTKPEAHEFLLRIRADVAMGLADDVTKFEEMIAEAIEAKRWDIIERLLDRIFGKYVTVQPGTEGKPTMLDELSLEQRKRMLEAAQKSIELEEAELAR